MTGTAPVCDRHGQAVVMRLVCGDRFVRLVDADGRPGASVDTGGSGLYACPVCGSTNPELPLPPAEARAVA